MTTYKKCGAELMENAEFCMECGCAVKAVTEKTCSECGKEVPSAAKFCPFCGSAVKNETAESETDDTQDSGESGEQSIWHGIVESFQDLYENVTDGIENFAEIFSNDSDDTDDDEMPEEFLPVIEKIESGFEKLQEYREAEDAENFSKLYQEVSDEIDKLTDSENRVVKMKGVKLLGTLIEIQAEYADDVIAKRKASGEYVDNRDVWDKIGDGFVEAIENVGDKISEFLLDITPV